MKLARDDVRCGLPVLSALNLLTLCSCYFILLYYLLLIVLRLIGVRKRCGVLFGVEYFLKLWWYFSLLYSVWHSAVFVYTTWLSVYDRSQDGRRFTEGGSSSQNLPSSSLPGSFIVFPPRIGLLRRSNGRKILRNRKEFSFDSDLMLGCSSFEYWAGWLA